jgi:cell division protein FtsN
VALLCGVLAALAVGCGDRSNLIPQSRADALTKQLADIKAAVDQGECDGLSDRVKTFHDDATNLSSSVDARLRKRINDGVASLQDTAGKDCASNRDAQTQTTDTTPTDTTPDTTTTETQTTETQTTETETTPTDTATTPTTPEPSTGTPETPSTATPPDTGGVTPGDGTTP